jgi:predicted dehydrogenase
MTGNKEVSLKMIKIGIIGAGRMARERLRCFGQMKDVKLVGIASRTRERAENLATQYGIKKVFNDYHQLLASDVEAVVVATPNDTHFRIVKDALKAGKDVLVECPMTLYSEQAWEIVQLAEEMKAIVEVGFDTRFHPFDQRMREALQSGKIGQPLWCYSELLYSLPYQPEEWYWQEKATRGMVVSWLVERFDLLRQLCGEVKSVFALQAPEVYVGENVFRQQTCIVNLQFQNSAIGVASASSLAPANFPNGIIKVIGREGGLWCNVGWGGEGISRLRVFTPEGEESEEIAKGWDTLFAETLHFVQCLRERMTPENPPINSFRALLIAEAALKSLQDNIPIFLPTT